MEQIWFGIEKRMEECYKSGWESFQLSQSNEYASSEYGIEDADCIPKKRSGNGFLFGRNEAESIRSAGRKNSELAKIES